MNLHQLNAEEALFNEAIRFSSENERAIYLDGACRGDADLRSRLETLLEEHFKSVAFQAAVKTPVDDSEVEGTVIGPYKLLQQIGEGGFGVVYMAEQQEPVRRRVALKIIKLGMDTKQVIARFEAERQALAMMEHPCIAKVLDAGATENGRPYFVMELVRGVAITEFCDENKLSVEERLGLFIDVCHAVQHAHQKGVIHRDLKPGNILITLHDDKAVPKVIDFGIAKATQQNLTDKTLFTRFEQFIGTPVYMSPEQVQMSGLDVDTRSDVYSLGVLLYELVAGVPPFDAKKLVESGQDEIRRRIREEEPPRPSYRVSTMTNEERTTLAQRRKSDPTKLRSRLGGELDLVVMKAMEKDRTRRYETANGLAADVRRFLRDEPVAAIAPGPVYLMKKYARRHRKTMMVIGIMIGLLVLGTVVSAWQAVRATKAQKFADRQSERAEAKQREAEQAQDEAVQAQNEAESNLYAADMNLVHHALRDGDIGRAQQLLDLYQDRQDIRGPEWDIFWEQSRGSHTHRIDLGAEAGAVQFFPGDSNRIFAATAVGSVTVHDLQSPDKPIDLADRGVHEIRMHRLAVSPDGSQVAAARHDGMVVWNVKDWSRVELPDDPSFKRGNYESLTFSPDGTFLAAKSGSGSRQRSVGVWNTANWTPLQEQEVQGRLAWFGNTLAFIDDTRLAIASADGISLWRIDLEQHRLVWERKLTDANMLSIATDGRHLVASSKAKEKSMAGLTVWDLASNQQVSHVEDGHEIGAFDLCLSPDGTRLYSAGWGDRLIKVWEFPNLRLLKTLRGHGGEVWSLDVSSDGKKLVSGSKDEIVHVWNTEDDPETADPLAYLPRKRWVSEDGSQMVGQVGPGEWAVWDAKKGQRLMQCKTEAQPLAFPEAGSLLFYHWDERDASLMLSRWNHPSTIVREIGRCEDLRKPESEKILGAANGNRFAVGLTDRFEIWEVESLKRVQVIPRRLDATMRQLSDSGDYLITSEPTSHEETQATVWNVEDGKPQVSFRMPFTLKEGGNYRARLQPAGDLLVDERFSNNSVVLIDIYSGRIRAELTGHTTSVMGNYRFTPDGRTLITRAVNNTTRLWHLATQREIARYDPDEEGGIDDRVIGHNLSGNKEFWRMGRAN